MPLSTSNSEPGWVDPPPVEAPFERASPALHFGRTTLVAVILFLAAITAWELAWRAYGATPSIQNSDGLWAMQRRRIDQGEGKATVLIGSSRILFDIDLDTWQRLSGERPIQLALEGTSPMFMLEELANDPKFTGRLVVGVASDIFFSGFAYRGSVQKYYRDETLSQRAGQWLSMHLIEPFFAFFDPDFALMTVLRRQDWPARAGVQTRIMVRKLAMHEADRNTHIWSKVENDPQYQTLAKKIWAQDFDQPAYKDMRLSGPEEMKQVITKQIDAAAAAVAKLRARGVEVVFVRAPTADRYLEYDNREYPRSATWDVLVQRSGARGIHFQDYPELQNYRLPEWSHLATDERARFTEALYHILMREHGWSQRPAQEGK
ncbi:hypothetical protein BH18PSE1_BH18PSE1_10860 [soil metagenome]